MKFKSSMLLIVLALLWGPTFLFVKVAVVEIPPLTLVAARVSLAAVTLYVILKVQGRTLPRFGATWKHFAVAGLLFNALPYLLLSWGQQYIDSALAAMLIGTNPIFTMILAHLFMANDQFTPAKGSGVVLAFGGLLLLLAPALLEGAQATTWGLLAATGAAACYAIATVYGKIHLRGLPPLVGPTAQLIMASIYLLPLSLLIEQPYALPMPSWPALSSMLLLAIPSTALAFIIYYRAQEIASPTSLSMITYMVPVVAMVLGVVVLDEQLGWNAYLGFGLIIAGLMIVNGLVQSIGWRRLSSSTARP